MTFTTLLNIELIGFMISLVINYFMNKGCLEMGITNEEELQSEKGLIIVISFFWWLFWPYFLYRLFKGESP